METPKLKLIDGEKKLDPLAIRMAKLAKADGIPARAIRAVLAQPPGGRTADQLVYAFENTAERVRLGLDPRPASFETDQDLRIISSQYVGICLRDLPAKTENGWRFGYDEPSRCSYIYRIGKEGTATGCFVPDLQIASVDLLSAVRFDVDKDWRFRGQMLTLNSYVRPGSQRIYMWLRDFARRIITGKSFLFFAKHWGHLGPDFDAFRNGRTMACVAVLWNAPPRRRGCVCNYQLTGQKPDGSRQVEAIAAGLSFKKPRLD